ncbi:centromere protein T isoform X2 [Neoarius graeffei]|uniref:centromere protein T isoform X2 n=1 Tax=Neoarius graeffei TaxID=443677 RepID=UPI00298C5B88|nr:centromere protein T isoform X2 [Neoarius graeffei]
MDCVEEEDVSARVLLRNVLHTETQRSPVTRSMSHDQRLSCVRRSSRLRDASETPRIALRHKLKQKLHETATQSPVPPSKRAKSQGRMLKTGAVRPAPALYSDDVTPRGLIRGIIQNEAEVSLVLPGQTALPDGDQQDVEASVHSNRCSDGVSGLELPDLATEPLTHVIRGMSRRRPPPTFNVSAFEKQLEQPSGEDEEKDVPQENLDISREQAVSAASKSDGVSGLELPDLATEPLTHVIRGMSRRRPPPTFNVSAFEKQLEQPSGEDEEKDVPQENLDISQEQAVSAASKSVLSLTLKTPFVNLQSERAGLRRKAVGRRKQVSVDAFDEAVQKRLERRHNQDYTVVQDGRTLQDSTWHKFTLGLSNVSVPELTTDVIMSNTELYAQPQASVSELRGADGRVTEAEMKRDDGLDVHDGGEELKDVIQDQQNVCESNVSKPQPDVSEHLGPDSQSKVGEDKVELMPPSQENEAVSSCPEEIPFSPTQAVADHVSQSQERESAVQEAQVEELNQGEGESLQGEETSLLRQRITRRAYHSEGGAIRNDVMVRGRGTKSLGMGHVSTEKQLQNFAGGPEVEDMVSVEEEPHRSSVSFSTNHTTKPSSSVTHQDSLVQNADKEDVIQDLGQSESEEVVVCLPVSPTVNVPAAEQVEVEEEQKEQEEEDKAEQWEEVEQEEEVAVEQEEEDEVEEEEQEEEDKAEQCEEVEQEEEEEQEEEDAQSEELSMQTPGFIKQRKRVSSPSALATPTVLKALNAGPAPKVVKPHPKHKPQRVSAGVLPKSYIMSVFKHFARTKVSSDVYPIISDILKKYFDRLADDLEVYSAHAKRKTIEVEDVELLMRRQGFVTDSTPVNVLIEKFLPLEYRKLLIPVATSGNKVVPDKRR